MEQSGLDVYTRALARAAELCGGRRQLARKLRVTTRRLDAWMQGRERAPAAVFLEVVDMLMEDSLGALRSTAKSPQKASGEDARS
jgi:hypothetical protein